MAEIYIPADSPLVFEEILRSDWEPTSDTRTASCYAGDTIDILFSVTKGGKAVNLTGCTADFVVASAPGEPALLEEFMPPDPTYVGNDGYGVTLDEPATGAGYVRLNDDETAGLGVGSYYYELEFDLNGLTVTVQTGSFTILVDTA